MGRLGLLTGLDDLGREAHNPLSPFLRPGSPFPPC